MRYKEKALLKSCLNFVVEKCTRHFVGSFGNPTFCQFKQWPLNGGHKRPTIWDSLARQKRVHLRVETCSSIVIAVERLFLSLPAIYIVRKKSLGKNELFIILRHHTSSSSSTKLYCCVASDSLLQATTQSNTIQNRTCVLASSSSSSTFFSPNNNKYAAAKAAHLEFLIHHTYMQV